MTGLILAGTSPVQAVLVQAVVMFLVLAATVTTTVVIALDKLPIRRRVPAATCGRYLCQWL